MEFLNPIDGDVLFSVADGVETEKGLKTKITVSAKPERKITICGVPATEENGVYSAEVILDSYRNNIVALDTESNEAESMCILWFKNAYKTYRLGIDDVILCLQNIYLHRDEYTSIFDDPFLKMFRDLHEKYGSHVHLHIYYETDDKSFNLSMFPDKYKPEFQANGDWLKFTFHAYSDHPDRPYRNATYEKVMEDGKAVNREILRFAGKEAMSKVTSQHWADSNLFATRGFRNLGYKCIDGYYVKGKDGTYSGCPYYLSHEQALHAFSRDFWYDTKEDILFVTDDIILNHSTVDTIDSRLDALEDTENNSFQYLLIHEQYFYESFAAYKPDYRERVFTAVDWCHRHGYRPSPISAFAFEESFFDTDNK